MLEDGPFFSTLPGKAEHTISWLGFKQMHDYFNQDEFDSLLGILLKMIIWRLFSMIKEVTFMIK